MNPETFFVDCDQAEFLYQKGLDGLDLLDRLSTNSILSLSEKGIKTTIVTDEKGKIVDILNVWKINNEKLLLESSTPNIDKLVFWINKFTIPFHDIIYLVILVNYLHQSRLKNLGDLLSLEF